MNYMIGLFWLIYYFLAPVIGHMLGTEFIKYINVIVAANLILSIIDK